jgi:hypothetical protein
VNTIVIAASTAHPCRVSFTIGRRCSQSAAGDQEDREQLEEVGERVGFSNGLGELMLKNPPPLVPSCLMAICEAAGPTAMVWVVTPCGIGTERLQQRDRLVSPEGLHDALCHEGQGKHEAKAAAGCRACRG